MEHLPCFKGQKWQWGILTFEVLWPEKLAPISHNDDSCVIQLTDGFHKILLTGDIEKQGKNHWSQCTRIGYVRLFFSLHIMEAARHQLIYY